MRGTAQRLRRALLQGAALVALLAVAGCDDGTPGLATRYGLFPADVPPQLRLENPADGTKVVLKRGQQLAVRLDLTSGTGFGWTYEQTGNMELFPSGETPTLEMAHADGRPGGGGILQFTFRATRTGSGTLKLNYRRPWETNVPPAKAITLDVLVQ